MHPVLLQRGNFVVHSYSVVLLAAFVIAGLVRRAESQRLGYDAQSGYRWVSVGALLGALLGSKLGMLLYVDRSAWHAVFDELWRLETSGKTVIGALMGGYLGVEIAKKLVGIRHSTGDAFAVAVPLSLGIGRIACVLGGCCYGTPSHQPWAIHLAGADRHPVQLYEAALDFALAAAVFSVRSPLRSRTQGCASTLGSRTQGCTSTLRQAREPGVLWRLSLIGYAGIRLLLDPWRGDARVWLGPVSAVQVLCALAICALWLVPRAMQTARSNG